VKRFVGFAGDFWVVRDYYNGGVFFAADFAQQLDVAPFCFCYTAIQIRNTLKCLPKSQPKNVPLHGA
jgi:hypothetical protein